MRYTTNNLLIVDLGRQGENLARTIEFDVSDMLTEWPGARIELAVRRKYDSASYLAETRLEGNVLYWPITYADTAQPGGGKLEIRAYSGDTLAKSIMGETVVHDSLTGDETAPPDPDKWWVDQVMKAADDAASATRMAVEATVDAFEAKNAANNAANTANSAASFANTAADNANTAAQNIDAKVVSAVAPVKEGVSQLFESIIDLPTKEEVFKYAPAAYEQILGYYDWQQRFVEGQLTWAARILRVAAKAGDKFVITRQTDQVISIIYLNGLKEIVSYERTTTLGTVETINVTVPRDDSIAYVDFYLKNLEVKARNETSLYQLVKETNQPVAAKAFVDCVDEFAFSEKNFRQDCIRDLGTYTASDGLYVGYVTPEKDTYYHIRGKSRYYLLALLDNISVATCGANNVDPIDVDFYVYCPEGHTLSVNIEYGYEHAFEKLSEITEDKLTGTKIIEKTVSVDVISGNVQNSGNIFIASSDATENEKAIANYVCDGVADEDEINAAIATIPVNGGKIQLSSGIFHIASPIIINKRVSVFGMGASVGSRPEYIPKNGNTFDTTFGKSGQSGSTTIRIEADCDGIQVTSFVRGLTFKDFFLQGYGKDRHTKAGIHLMQSTDVLLIDGINISDCCMCLYAPSSQDAPCIVNSGFEWCGCGMMIKSSYGKFANLIFCDNNGLDEYDGTVINCGGMWLSGNGNTITGSQLLRSNKYKGGTTHPTHLMRLSATSNSTIYGNVFSIATGCGIYLGENSNCNVISGNTITNVCESGEEGFDCGIYASNNSEGIIVNGNNIGLSLGTDALKEQYHMQYAAYLACLYGTGHVVTGNRSAYAENSNPFYCGGDKSVVANNLIGN